MTASRFFVPLLLGVGSLAGCYASNVVDVDMRAVRADTTLADVAWRKAGIEDLRGLFESVEVQGDAAISLRRVYYLFEPGRYTGAALIEGEQGLEFQTLAGAWSLDADGLRLDDGESFAADASSGMLRLQPPGGSIILRSVTFQ